MPVHSDHFVDLLQLLGIGIVYESVFLCLVFDISQAELSMHFALVELFGERGEMRILFEHSLKVIIDEIEKAGDAGMVFDSPASLDEDNLCPVILGERQSPAHCQKRKEKD